MHRSGNQTLQGELLKRKDKRCFSYYKHHIKCKMRKLLLSNGLEIPAIGLGACIIPYGEDKLDLYKKEYDFYCYAIGSGKSTLFDTSAAYGRNDEALGAAVRDTAKRKDIQIMTKISNMQQREGNIRRAFEKHLEYLKTDYVDIYLIHWPQTGTFINVYLEMEKLYEEGLIKAIGVSNCNIHHLKTLMYHVNIKPMINQFEITPLFTQDALVNYCKAFDIVPVAYSPLGTMHDVLIKAEPVRRLAQKYSKSPAQIIMKWHETHDRGSIVETRNEQHFVEIFEELDSFSLEEKEIYWLNSLNDNIRLRYNPDTADFSAL